MPDVDPHCTRKRAQSPERRSDPPNRFRRFFHIYQYTYNCILSRFLQADDRARTVLATLNVKVTRGFAFGNWHYPASRAGTGKGLQGFDITQAEFASRIGVRQSYLSAVERGRGEVGAEVLLAISREFGKSLEWLLTGEE